MTELRSVFDGVAWKHLTAVDSEPDKSNQHELGGLKKAGFSRFLQDPAGEKIRYPAEFVWLDEDEERSISASGFVTWYDSRYGKADRGPELRLYYSGNAVSEKMQQDDFCLLAKRKTGEILVVACRPGETTENQLRWLFDLEEVKDTFDSKDASHITQKPEFPAAWVLDLLGVVFPSSRWETFLGQMLDTFGNVFPSTRVFSEFARSCVSVSVEDAGCDEALLVWMEAEEGLFRVFERHLVDAWLEAGFKDVDDFVSKSLSVQNRRKSRAGYALENHLEFIFQAKGLDFDRGATTEEHSKPDFLFPGAKAYHDPEFPTQHLRVLGAKSTCKDRWRQVLAEAERVDEKHLITLEPAISGNQTDQMKKSLLQLVVPLELQDTYQPNQRSWLLSLENFLDEVTQLQKM